MAGNDVLASPAPCAVPQCDVRRPRLVALRFPGAPRLSRARRLATRRRSGTCSGCRTRRRGGRPGRGRAPARRYGSAVRRSSVGAGSTVETPRAPADIVRSPEGPRATPRLRPLASDGRVHFRRPGRSEAGCGPTSGIAPPGSSEGRAGPVAGIPRGCRPGCSAPSSLMAPCRNRTTGGGWSRFRALPAQTERSTTLLGGPALKSPPSIPIHQGRSGGVCRRLRVPHSGLRRLQNLGGDRISRKPYSAPPDPGPAGKPGFRRQRGILGRHDCGAPAG